MAIKRPEITTIFTNPKTGHHVGLGDFGEDGLPRYAACWTDKIPLMPEDEVCERNPNVNWDLVEEMYGPEGLWTGRKKETNKWQQVWNEFDGWYKTNTRDRSVSWEEQKSKIQEVVERNFNILKPSNINFSDCIICGKFIEHDHKCEGI